ncbi:MAG: FkbM family methyltransferase [Actinomycetota bacterium]|nr:FkbM family methyltransferase [Actinomycetota bacterium]
MAELALELPAPRPGPPVEATLPLAGLVEESGAFAARERAGARVVAGYRLREGRAPLLLRHRSPDLGVLGEVLGDRVYEPPGHLALPAAPRVVDAGANIGLFGLFARLRLGAARVTSFEPDRFNLPLLRAVAGAGGGAWEVVAACAGVRDGEVAFGHGQFACSRLEGEGRAEVADLFAHLAGADLLKLDVEGGEWAVLADPRLATEGPPAVVLEYHPFLAPSADARGAAHALLRAAGYATQEVLHRADGVGTLWAWRPS